MKLLWCCVVAVSLCLAVNAAVDIERTVKHVESILQANRQLPRLTRDEIMQLLNDIKAEDAKTNNIQEYSNTQNRNEYKSLFGNEEDNEVSAVTKIPVTKQEDLSIRNNIRSFPSSTEKYSEYTTKSNEPSVMVVLPYTPRDGSSLQELYTRPPRVEVLPLSKVTPRPTTTSSPDAEKRLEEALVSLTKAASNKNSKQSLPPELESFLNAHGLNGQNGQDHFLLPLDGFKPLPPARLVDGSVELPENILLTYDLLSPSSEQSSFKESSQTYSHTNYLYEPLQPDYPFELDTSSSEKKKITLPLDMPKGRHTKSSKSVPQPNYEPIDYDSVRVIPLNKGPNPIEDSKVDSTNDVSKRQINTTDDTLSTNNATSASAETTTALVKDEPITNAPPEAPAENDSAAAAADNDSGASISDLEESFGGAAPEKPGDSELPPPKKNGFYWMVDWNSFLEVGDGDTKVNIRFEPKLGDPQMFIPVNVP